MDCRAIYFFTQKMGKIVSEFLHELQIGVLKRMELSNTLLSSMPHFSHIIFSSAIVASEEWFSFFFGSVILK